MRNRFIFGNSYGSVEICPIGGYITSWKKLNPTTRNYVELLYKGSTIKRTGIPILFPQFGPAEGMQKHGFGRDSDWTIVTNLPESLEMKLTDIAISPEAKKQYPYSFSTSINVKVTPNGDLQYQLFVTNTGSTPLPISPGLHPYWAVSHQQKKNVTIQGILGFDASLIDWDSAPPDKLFPYTGKTTIHLPNAIVSIEDQTVSGPLVSHIVVWSQPLSLEDYNYICVEPVCGENNALTSHPILVESQKTWHMTILFSAQILG